MAKETTPNQTIWDAAKRGQHHKLTKLVQEQVKDGKVGKENKWLTQTMFAIAKHGNPERRGQMVKALAPYWEFDSHSEGVKRGTLDIFMNEGAYECLPLLVEIGYTLRYGSDEIKHSRESGRGHVARDLGRGEWPHPDVLCPDLFSQADAREMLGYFSSQLFCGQRKDNRTLPSKLTLDGIDRMAPLFADADPQLVKEEVAKGLAEMTRTTDNWNKFVTQPDTQDMFVKLMDKGLLDEEYFEKALPGLALPPTSPSPMVVPSLRILLAKARSVVMESNTEPADIPTHKRGMRL